MPCLLAVVVFGIMGIFSATHRDIAREALDCVFKRIRFKPCESGLDKRLKSQVIGKLMKRSPRIAGFGFRYFEVISWVFTILMFGSMIWSGMSVYRFAMYGNCHGANSQEECDFNGLIRVLDALDAQKANEPGTAGTTAVPAAPVTSGTNTAPASSGAPGTRETAPATGTAGVPDNASPPGAADAPGTANP